jgi:hypothetical protein
MPLSQGSATPETAAADPCRSAAELSSFRLRLYNARLRLPFERQDFYAGFFCPSP